MSLWGQFTGADAARRQANETSRRNEAFIGQGRDRELGYYGAARDASRGYLHPYESSGRQGQDAYTNLLGMNGAGAQAGARQAYDGFNPYLQGDMTSATRALDRRAAATGNFNSGLNMLAGARTRADMGTQDFNNYANRLQGLGAQGFAAANGLMGNEWQYGTAAGGAERAATQGYVNNNTQTGNALSAANVSPMSYIMKNAELALKAFGAMKGGMGGGSTAGGNNFSYADGGSNQLQSSNYNDGWGYFGGGR